MKGIDRFYLAYMILHVPITVFVDSNLVIPSEYQLSISKAILNFHLEANKDFLLVTLPLWLKVFGLIELVFQLPLFVYCAVEIWKQTSVDYYLWMIVYGFNAALTTLVCMAYVWVDGTSHGLLLQDVVKLELIYFPYLLIPGYMLVDHFQRVKKLLKRKIE